MLLFSHRDYTFHSLKPPDSWTGSKPHERVMLNHMFADGATDVRLSDLKNQFYVAIPTIKENISRRVKSKGMYSVDPDSAHAYVFLGILLTVAPFMLVQVLGIASILESPGLLIASASLAVIVIIIFARIMTAKSKKGRADQDRNSRLPGVHQSRGCRSPAPHAARYLREVPALRHGARHREPLGQGL